MVTFTVFLQNIVGIIPHADLAHFQIGHVNYPC